MSGTRGRDQYTYFLLSHPDDETAEQLFVAYWPLVDLLGEMFVQNFCLFFTGCRLFLSYKSSFCILDTSPLSPTCFAYILSHLACLFIFLIGVFHRIEVLNFGKSQFINFFLMFFVSSRNFT